MRLMRYEDGLWPNLAASTYILTAYFAGWVLLLQHSLVLFLIGIVLLMHAMVIAAYLLHECAHHTIFIRNEWNARLGRILMWFTGACYGAYEEIRNKHFRHHVDRSDVISCDYRPFLKDRPWLLQFVNALEWSYIPAVEILMHAMLIVLPFVSESRRHMRRHVLIVLAIRGVIFGAIFAVAPLAIMGYVIAYSMFMTVLRFMDAFQHTYEIVEVQENQPAKDIDRRDSDYEYRNTYSNLISERHPWLNLLTLNFAYHNAHHTKPTAAWYQLPRLHRERFGNDHRQVLPLREQLIMFHRFRVPRILSEKISISDNQLSKGVAFVGVDGVSFLTSH